MAQDLSPGKSACILAVVVGCFAILWPSIFYPMLKGSVNPPRDDGSGCCHVLLDKDVNGVKLVLDLCNAVLKKSEKFDIVLNKLDHQAVERCRSLINSTCSIDIRILLKDKIRLDPSYKSTLEQLRTVNSSFCLKYHFDINLDIIGVPHRLKNPDFISHSSKPKQREYNRQERSPYLRPNAMHPALRERGRAVPQPHSPPPPPRERSSAPPPVIAAKKPPIPGVRPPMGGGGHVPAQKGSGPMGILMPLYTVGIVIFFVYTITKLVCKKHDSNTQYIHDPEFHRLVFQNNPKEPKPNTDVKSNGNILTDTSKLGDIEINRLRKRLAETEATMERIVKQMNLVSQSLSNPHNEDSPSDESNVEKPIVEELKEKQSSEKGAENRPVIENGHSNHDGQHEVNGLIQVVGMETTESCANGQPWKHSLTESTTKSSKTNGCPKDISVEEIILPTKVPINSQIFISDASTRSVAEEPSVIVESKVTLNVIANDSHPHPKVTEDNTKANELDEEEEEEEEEENEIEEVEVEEEEEEVEVEEDEVEVEEEEVEVEEEEIEVEEEEEVEEEVKEKLENEVKEKGEVKEKVKVKEENVSEDEESGSSELESFGKDVPSTEL